MQVFFINSSVYGKNSDTEKLFELMENAFKEAKVIKAYLEDDNILNCNGCGNCIKDADSVCKLNDDVGIYLKNIAESDLVVLGAPIYLSFFPAKLKNLIERLRPFSSGFYSLNKNNEFYAFPKSKKVINFFAVSTCGYPTAKTFFPVRTYFDHLFDEYENFKNMGGIFVPAFKAILATDADLFEEIKIEIIKTTEKVKSGQRAIMDKEWLSKERFIEILKSANKFK